MVVPLKVGTFDHLREWEFGLTINFSDRDLAPFIDPPPEALRVQWLSVLNRVVPDEKNQVPFIPSEIVLSLCCSLLVDHSRFGSGSAPRAGFPVPELSRLYKRPPTSIISKMANLDPKSLRNRGGKYDRSVAARLMPDIELLQDVYLRIIRAGRSVGIGQSQLPDFLGLEAGGNLWLDGQEELVDVEREVDATLRELADKGHAGNIGETERLLTSAVRIGQHRFANQVLTNHGHKCVFCGMSGTIAGKRRPRLLTASHIKPWRSSNGTERLDLANGLAACPTHDVAFDTGLITVDSSLRIHRTPDLEAAIRWETPLRHAFGTPPLADKLILPQKAHQPDIVYLDWHRTQIFYHG